VHAPPVAHQLAMTIPVDVADEVLRRKITQNGVVSPLLGVFERPSRPSVADLARHATHLVVAEAVDNPVNIGSIVRNAAGLGWQGLVLDRTSADPLARRALRVAMGHALAFPHARTADLAASLIELRDAGFTVIALTPAAGAVDLDRLAGIEVAGIAVVDDGARRAGTPPRVALVVGAERTGLSDPVLAVADHRVRIPMEAGVDSLNVAAATAIACHILRPRSPR
jgi:tRNA G18 (ribose-2'-O)-methylase SpoU